MGPTVVPYQNTDPSPLYLERKHHLQSLCDRGWQGLPDTIAVHGTGIEALDLIAQTGSLPGSHCEGMYPDLGRMYFYMLRGADIRVAVNANLELFTEADEASFPVDFDRYHETVPELMESTEGYATELARNLALLNALDCPYDKYSSLFADYIFEWLTLDEFSGVSWNREKFVDRYLLAETYGGHEQSLEIAKSVSCSPGEVYDVASALIPRRGVVIGINREMLARYAVHPGDTNICKPFREGSKFTLQSQGLADFYVKLKSGGLPMELITEIKPLGPEVPQYFSDDATSLMLARPQASKPSFSGALNQSV